jgi:hypothetical protein
MIYVIKFLSIGTKAAVSTVKDLFLQDNCMDNL